MSSTSFWQEFPSAEGRSWARQLGDDESAYYWDSFMRGATDMMMSFHVSIDVKNRHLLTSPSNVQRAWIELKKRHPLCAAEIVECGPDDLRFIVNESRVNTNFEDEVLLRSVETEGELTAILNDLTNGPRHLRSNMLSRALVVSLPNPDRQGTDDPRYPDHYRCFFSTAHTITDALSSFNVARSFFEIITRTGPVKQVDIAERLKMLPALGSLLTNNSFSLARRRWRRAIAQTILTNRNKRQSVSYRHLCAHSHD